MGLFLFKTKPPKKYNYKPVYYDPSDQKKGRTIRKEMQRKGRMESKLERKLLRKKILLMLAVFVIFVIVFLMMSDGIENFVEVLINGG